MNPLKLSIFEEKAVQNGERIYVNGIQEEVRQIFKELGGPRKVSKLLGLNYVGLKEWSYRKSVSLSNLSKLLGLLPKQRSDYFAKKIEEKDFRLSSGRSVHQLKFPKKISEDLAYVVGLILGDGSLPCDKSNINGNWSITVFFDNKDHAGYYSDIIQSLFGVQTKQFFRRGCYATYFFSSVAHWFFRTYFGFHNGKKAHKIEVPQRVLSTKDEKLINACLRGLFDSDGTIIENKAQIKYASVSKKIVDQVAEFLQVQGMVITRCQWLKDPKYKMLYDVRSSGTKNLQLFHEKIGFKHPAKSKKLYNLLYKESLLISPVE